MKKALVILVTMALVIPLELFGEPIEKNDLTGVWEAKISPTGVPPPPIRALSMFRKDFFDANWKTLLTNTGEVKGTRLQTPDWK
jgi:hypothetical protein